MHKKVFGRNFSRETDSRKALFRSLVRALVLNGSMVTTKAKAKAVRGEVDKLITLAKDESIAARRRALAKLGNDRQTVDMLYTILPSFSGRNSGYTRITQLPPRRGDAAEMVRMEFTDKVSYVKKEPLAKKTVKESKVESAKVKPVKTRKVAKNEKKD